MDIHYPTPGEVGITIPADLKENRFRAGFRHALQGGQLDQVAYLRLSFREGFRAAKLFLTMVRRSRAVLQFPMCARVRMRVG